MSRGGWAILIALAAMAPLAMWLARADGRAANRPSAVAEVFVSPEACLPEPGERAAFLACAIGLPAILFGAAAIGEKLRSRAGEAAPPQDDLVALAFVLAATAAAWLGIRAEGYHALFMNAFGSGAVRDAVLLTATAALLRAGGRGGRTLQRICGVAAIAAIVATAALRVFDEAAKDALGGHFEPVYHPLVQVALGKSVLVDMTSQYGLFPHFLAPIFAVFGLSVLKFTIVVALLVAAVFAALWAFLRGATENRAAALLGLLAILAVSAVPLFETNDLYFQYVPIRMVAPVASVWLTWRYLTAPSRRRYWATTLALGFGPLWNLDTGLPALASWLGVLAYGELASALPIRQKLVRIAGHLGAGIAGAGLAVAGYALAIFLRAGRLPDFVSFLEFQRIFYGAGFCMLPMPAIGGWWAVALIYLAGLAYAARALVAGRITPRSAMVFHLATLGVGLFSYYQGRSHPRVLSLVWWPAYVLATLFLDELISDSRRTPARLSRLAAAGVLTWVVAGSAWAVVDRGPFLRDWYRSHLLAATERRPSPMLADVATIKRAQRQGHRVLTISENESLISARAGARSEWRSSQVEALLVEDFRAMARRLAAGEFDRVWISRTSLRAKAYNNLGLIALSGALRTGRVVEQTPLGFLIDPRPTPEDRGVLPPGDPASPIAMHAVYADGRFDARPPFPPMSLGERFTIEAILRPGADQSPAATVFGNHPGRVRAISGFTLQRDTAPGDGYALHVGDGRAFHLLSSFRLRPDRWNSLTITVGDGAASTYLDGRLVDSRPAPMAILDSDLPVAVGDWYGADRPFGGGIAEIRITRGAVNDEEVVRRWAAIRRGIEEIAAREAATRR